MRSSSISFSNRPDSIWPMVRSASSRASLMLRALAAVILAALSACRSHASAMPTSAIVTATSASVKPLRRPLWRSMAFSNSVEVGFLGRIADELALVELDQARQRLHFDRVVVAVRLLLEHDGVVRSAAARVEVHLAAPARVVDAVDRDALE